MIKEVYITESDCGIIPGRKYLVIEWHSQLCRQDREKYERLVKEFKDKYPDYCETCQGWGFFEETYDPSPPGVSLSPGYLTDREPCPDCQEEGLCPRCKAPITGRELYCEECDWHWHDSGMPMAPECSCWHTRPYTIVRRIP